jgi:predicted metal-dependent phosphoesterase TrpH
MRCDLHVHTRHSGAVDLPLLRHVGRESYSEPIEVYWTALRRGMDLVTITDHDTIEGALQIAHLPQAFVSEEVTCWLPEGRRLHLGVFDIDARHHVVIQSRASDAEALFAYLAEQRLPFCLNHPFSPLTGKREIGDLHLGLERAASIEVLNSMMPAASNEHARAAARLSGRPEVGGSDAHALPSVAKAFTEVPAARTREAFLSGLRAGMTLARGESGSYRRLVGDIGTVFAGALGENTMLAGRSLGDLGRLAAAAALVPVLLLLPAIALTTFLRERIMAEAYHRRFLRSLVHRRPPAVAAPMAEVA